jgi:hypothetical protein
MRDILLRIIAKVTGHGIQMITSLWYRHNVVWRVAVPGITAHRQVNPGREEDGSRWKWVFIVPKVHEESKRKTTASTIATDDDVLWRNVEIVNQSQV